METFRIGKLAKKAARRAENRAVAIVPRRVRRVFENPVKIGARYEPWTNRAYAAMLAVRTGTFIDVGANTGQTLRKLLYLDPGRPYVGFEPQIRCAFEIGRFLEENRLSRHTILPVGLSNRNGAMELLKRAAQSDTASMISGFRPDDFYTTRETVYVARGDDVMEDMGIGEISVIKVDVEGGELEVIEGFERTLRSVTPFVFFEVLNHFLLVTHRDLDDATIAFREHRNSKLMDVLRGAGYTVFNVRPNGGLAEISEFKPQRGGDLGSVNYVAVPAAGRAAFLAAYEGNQGTP